MRPTIIFQVGQKPASLCESSTFDAMKEGLLVLLRHGESVWNAEGKFAGASDVPLSALGMGQAMAAGLLLRHLSFDLVCTSTMQRALHTWELMRGHLPAPVELQKHAWLNERNFGLLEGRTKTDIQTQYGLEQMERWRFGWDETLPEGSGETFLQMCQRIVPPFEEALRPRLNQGEKILLVAHGQVLRGIAMYLENAKIEEAPSYSMANAVPLAYNINADQVARIDL